MKVALGAATGAGRAAAAAAAALSTPPREVPRIDAAELTYERFCLVFMEPGLPVIIRGVTEGWSAATEWVTPGGGIDHAALRDRFGTALVSVTDTSSGCE